MAWMTLDHTHVVLMTLFNLLSAIRPTGSVSTFLTLTFNISSRT
jgi:small neutral amino acid transporter SnatA (MarC family)